MDVLTRRLVRRAPIPNRRRLSPPGPTLASMTTKVRNVTHEELLARRAEILHELGLTEGELAHKAATGGLVGTEWAAWSEIEGIDYLLAGD